MDIFLIIIGVVLLIVGLIGCVMPVIPGPPVAWLSLLILQFSDKAQHNWQMVWTTFAVAVIVQVLDYIIPAMGTKKFGGSKYGVWGAVIGLVVGLITPIPLGVIVGPFLGAFIGELIRDNHVEKALKSAMGSLIGFLFSTGLKIVVTLYFGYLFFEQITF